MLYPTELRADFDAAVSSFSGRIASLRGARNPHVLKYIPVAALRAPCTSSRKSELSATSTETETKLKKKAHF
jgi:hypothetical protein